MTIREHKYNASSAIGSNLWAVAKIMLVYDFFMSLADIVMDILGLSNTVLLSAIPLSSLLLKPAFIIGLSSVALTLQRGREPDCSQLKEGFEHYGKSMLLYYSCLIPSLLWGILFIVPGVIKWYSYSMAPFIMAENPGFSAEEAREWSAELTREYKLRIFLLDLSFVGWGAAVLILWSLLKTWTLLYLLVGLAVSLVLSLWVIPYVITSRADLYQYLKTQKDDETLRNLGKKDAEEADSIDDAYWFPITPEMQKKWHDRHQKIKNTIIITGASVLLIAFAVCGWTIYKIKVKDQVPAIVPDAIAQKIDRNTSGELEGYMWWTDDSKEPKPVTVKIDGRIEDGVYRGDIEVVSAGKTLYLYDDVYFSIGNSSGNSHAVSHQHESDESFLAFIYLPIKGNEIVIEPLDMIAKDKVWKNGMWVTPYENIGEPILIYAPASSAQEAHEKYMNTFVD